MLMSTTAKLAFKLGLVLVLLAASTSGQGPVVDCPRLILRPPAALVAPEDKATLALELSGSDAALNSLFVEWFVSRGRITGGQGKKVVEISTAEEDEGMTIKVAV